MRLLALAGGSRKAARIEPGLSLAAPALPTHLQRLRHPVAVGVEVDQGGDVVCGVLVHGVLQGVRCRAVQEAGGPVVIHGG